MDIRKLQRVIVDALEDVKAQDIKVFNTTHLTSLFDRVIVASGTSNRQTKSLASNVREKVKENGGDVISTEGEDSGEWVLVDCGDAVVHILQPALRQYYNLEEIWGDKPVRIKLSTSNPFGGASAPVNVSTATMATTRVNNPVTTSGRHLRTAAMLRQNLSVRSRHSSAKRRLNIMTVAYITTTIVMGWKAPARPKRNSRRAIAPKPAEPPKRSTANPSSIVSPMRRRSVEPTKTAKTVPAARMRIAPNAVSI